MALSCFSLSLLESVCLYCFFLFLFIFGNCSPFACSYVNVPFDLSCIFLLFVGYFEFLIVLFVAFVSCKIRLDLSLACMNLLRSVFRLPFPDILVTGIC